MSTLHPIAMGPSSLLPSPLPRFTSSLPAKSNHCSLTYSQPSPRICCIPFTHGQPQPQPPQNPDEEEFHVLMEMQSLYNHILILDTPKSRLLLLDSSHNVHSMFNKGPTKWTGSYWDQLASLPPVIPEGPIAIFGLGGGTTAHLMLELWPSLQLEGWEIDEILIYISRDYLGLSDIEKLNVDGGVLNVRIGDVFSPDASIPGGYAGKMCWNFPTAIPSYFILYVTWCFVYCYLSCKCSRHSFYGTLSRHLTPLMIGVWLNKQISGIVVDLFAEGKVLPQLEQPSTWLEFYEKLKPDGRLMVNCGAGEKRLPDRNAIPQRNGLSQDDTWKPNATIRALCKAFPGQVNWKKMAPSAGENYLALTGSLPDLATWSAALPIELKSSVYEWKICNIEDN